MGKVIGDILPLAVGIAISPVPIIAVILMLSTSRGSVNGPSFLIGWLGGAAIAGTIILVIADSIGISSGDPSKGAYAFKILLGVVLLFAAFRNWRKRPKEGEEPEMPSWMKTIDKFTWPKSMVFGAVFSAVNPKNLILLIAAASAIAQSSISAGRQAVTLVIFIVIATIGVALPLVVYFAMKERAVKILDGWNRWLTLHNSAVMVVLFLVFGVLLIGKGVTGLT